MSKKKWWQGPEIIVALSAVVVSVCALAVTTYEASLARRQHEISVWPWLEVSFSNVAGYTLSVENKGVGPAIVKGVRVAVDGKVVRNWSHVRAESGAGDEFVTS